ncbi:MAG: MFS transporter, partial [Candidatus Hodarchaeota archaeon]
FLADGILSLVAFLAAFKLIRDKERAPASHSLNAFKGIKQLLQSKSIYLYLLLGISAMFSFGVLESFVPTKAQIIGLFPWQIGAIMAVGALVHSVVSFSVGSLSDKYGRRLFAIVAQPVIVISGIALFFCNNFYLILIVYGIFCIGETITFLLSFVYASESFDQEYVGTSMGIFDSLIDLSLFVAPLISISVFNITTRILYPFIIAVIPASICLIFSFSLPGRKTENN